MSKKFIIEEEETEINEKFGNKLGKTIRNCINNKNKILYVHNS